MKTKWVRLGTLVVSLLMLLVFGVPPRSTIAACGSGADYRSIATGNWGTVATWECFNGVTWEAAASAPGASDNVYIQTGHTVTLTQDESVNDLALHNASADRLVTGSFTVNVYGKMRCFNSALNSFPFTFSSSPSSRTTWINTTGGGKVKLMGNSRTAFNTGEWGANPPGWRLEIAPNPGETISAVTNIKAANITIASGTLDMTTKDLRVDSDGATNGAGTLTVNSGATLRMGGGYIRRTSTGGWFQTFTLDGTLVFYGTTVGQLGAATINLNGTVEYAASGNQTFVTNYSPPPGGGGAEPSTYTNLTLSGSGTKTLSMNTTVNGRLTLTSVDLTTGSNTLTMSNSATTTGDYDVVGFVKRTNPTAGAKTYGSQYTTLNFGSDVVGDVTVSMQKSVSGFTVQYVNRQYDITVPAGTADVQLHYQCGDLIGSPVETNMGLWRWNGSRWVLQGRDGGSLTQCPGGNAGYVQKNGVSTFSSWAITDNGSPTAVTLSSITVQGHQDSSAIPGVLIALGGIVGIGMIVGVGTLRRKRLVGSKK